MDNSCRCVIIRNGVLTPLQSYNVLFLVLPITGCKVLFELLGLRFQLERCSLLTLPRNRIPLIYSSRSLCHLFPYILGQYIMTPTPIRQIEPPRTSNRSGRMLSTFHPHRIDSTTNTPPLPLRLPSLPPPKDRQ